MLAQLSWYSIFGRPGGRQPWTGPFRVLLSGLVAAPPGYRSHRAQRMNRSYGSARFWPGPAEAVTSRRWLNRRSGPGSPSIEVVPFPSPVAALPAPSSASTAEGAEKVRYQSRGRSARRAAYQERIASYVSVGSGSCAAAMLARSCATDLLPGMTVETAS
ncbi:hypothetical protein BDK92_0141 [Micromonospora pisi]|uniref:Uncharacterized protein n=1 Tax=Micromonospora pisi TaxID=589240 RepID=A0A495JAI5_9ACTN|nr:hypothetical protein BDK92_0141 [Micromonospora pisi]